MSRITFRPLTADDSDLFTSFGPPSRSGHYRPDWLWVAERGPEVVARAAFWAPEGEPRQWRMLHFDPGTVEIGAALIAAASDVLGRPLEYILHISDARRDVAVRRAAAERAGLALFVERLSLRWVPKFGLPPRPGRLRFTPAADDPDATRDVLARVCTGALCAYTRRDVERYGLAKAVEVTIDELVEFPGSTGWDNWRLARTPAGEFVGVLLGTRNSIGYLGVVPEHRGRHYSDDLVIEALHIFTAAGGTAVHDGTDVGNTPMAASFARCNYEVSGRFMVFT